MDTTSEARPTCPGPASVVLPVRNVARLLPRQLDALARQTVIDRLEIIIVDDASTDATVAAAHRWSCAHSDIRVRVVQRPRHNGPNAARNHGIRLATTPTVLLCDGDDVAAPEWAEHLLAELERHPGDQVLVSGRCVGLDAADQPTDTTIHGEMLHRGTRYMLGGNGAFRRTRGYAYLTRRHGQRWASSRPIDVFVLPWKQFAATTAVVLLGRVPRREFPHAVGHLVGSMLWGARFVLHLPRPLLGLAASPAR